MVIILEKKDIGLHYEYTIDHLQYSMLNRGEIPYRKRREENYCLRTEQI